MVVILFGNSKDNIFGEFDHFTSKLFSPCFAIKNGVACGWSETLVSGRAHADFRVRGILCLRTRTYAILFTDMICVSMAVVGDNGKPLAG